jgi:hypothetical protein
MKEQISQGITSARAVGKKVRIRQGLRSLGEKRSYHSLDRRKKDNKRERELAYRSVGEHDDENMEGKENGLNTMILERGNKKLAAARLCPEKDRMADLPNVDLTTLTGHAVHIRNL